MKISYKNFARGVTAALTCIMLAANTPEIQAQTGYLITEEGHLDWLIDGEVLLTSRHLTISSLDFEDTNEDRILWEAIDPEVETVEGGIRYAYDWGNMTLLWKTEAGLVYGTLILENTTDLRIGDFELDLFTVQQPDEAVEISGFDSFQRTNLDHFIAQEWQVGETRLTFGIVGQDPPVYLFQNSLEANSESMDWVLRLTGGVHRMDDGGITFPLFGTARVEPGSTLEIPFILKETPLSVPGSVAGAVFRSHLYKQTIQPLDWPDRRPIGSIFVTKFGGATESNPKALFWDDDLDASDPEAVRASAIAFAERSVEALQALDAQGAIVWDLEGGDFPFQFAGSPRMLPIMNPAMDAVADEFFQFFTDAGIRTGVTLRPVQPYFDESRGSWRQGTGSHGGPGRNPLNESYDDIWPDGVNWWRFFPTVERFDRKIQYAKDRWGCSIFYIDTNGEFRMMNALGGQNVGWILLSANLIRELRERHPDVLIIPELIQTAGNQPQIAYYGVSAPYGELDLGDTETPAWIRTVYPEAFSVINVSDGNIDNKWNELVEAVRGGDILMTRGWFINDRNEQVQAIYREAAAGEGE